MEWTAHAWKCKLQGLGSLVRELPARGLGHGSGASGPLTLKSVPPRAQGSVKGGPCVSWQSGEGVGHTQNQGQLSLHIEACPVTGGSSIF